MLGRLRPQRSGDEAFWRDALVMAAVAERAAALIDVCGESGFARRTLPVLDAVWDGVSKARRADGPNPLRSLERLAGPKEPDDDTPAYLALAAVEGLVAAAVMAFRVERYGDPTGVGHNIHGALDGVIHFALDPRPIIVDPRNPLPSGPFEAREYAACLQDQDTATGEPFTAAATGIRARARSGREMLRADIRRALSEVRAFGRDW
jgi:hypothetical protein